MKRINSLSDLLIEELADLLDAENQLIEALPQMAKACQWPELKSILEDHIEVTKDQAHRLKDIFSNIGQNPPSVDCITIKKFIEASEDIVNTTVESSARDTALIGVAQSMEHYEITGYGTAREHADALGHTRMVELLDKTINEERLMNLHLSELAQSIINVQAIAPDAAGMPKNENKGFYVSEKFKRGGVKKKPKGADVSRFISEGNPNTQEDSNKDT